MKDQPKVVSVVVHYNSPGDCIHLLNSLKAIICQNHRVVVVDNCSTEDAYNKLEDFVKGCGHELLCEIIRNKENVGFGGGVNFGFDYAFKKYKPSYLHVINTDAELINPNYLKELVEVLEKDQSIGIVGPAVLKEDRKTLQNTILPFVSLSTAFNFKKAYANLSVLEEIPTIRDVECVNGVCFVVRAVVFASIGGFDKTYFMYGEEQDLCYEIFKKGFRRVYWSGLSIVHLGAEKTSAYSIDWRYVHVRKNQVKFLSKHNQWPSAFLLASLFSIKTALFYLKSKGNSDQKLKAILKAYFRSL